MSSDEQTARIAALQTVAYWRRWLIDHGGEWSIGGAELAAVQRGDQGERPDAAAIAEAEQRGRESVLAVVENWLTTTSTEEDSTHPFNVYAAGVLRTILRACGEEKQP